MARFDKLEFNTRNATSPEENGRDPAVCDAGYWMDKADQSRRTGLYESALKYYSRALELDRSIVAGWAGQVQMLVQLEEYPEAELWSRKGLELFPKNGELMAARAQAFCRLADIKRPLRWFASSSRRVSLSLVSTGRDHDRLASEYGPLLFRQSAGIGPRLADSPRSCPHRIILSSAQQGPGTRSSRFGAGARYALFMVYPRDLSGRVWADSRRERKFSALPGAFSQTCWSRRTTTPAKKIGVVAAENTSPPVWEIMIHGLDV